jgi:hypothetical protein
MERRRKPQRVTGWLGVVAVLSNLFASVLCMAPAKAAGLVEDILGPLVMCTADGSHSVPASAPQGDNNPGQPGGKASHCTACTLLAGLALGIALVFALLAFPERIFRAFASSARTLADHLSLGGIRSRAPPLPA